MKLLLLSNSTNAGESYLGWPQPYISDFLKKHHIKKVLFVPYAGVSLSNVSLEESYNVYETRVAQVFATLNCDVVSVHRFADPVQAVADAACIAVGGGNTFHLVAMMHQTGLMQAIKDKVSKGTPFMGWSAGSNVACPTLRTTNDMPIIEPASFDCLNFVPFQINPHYLDANPEGHGGETRQQRIEEFMVINRNMPVLGLREASLLEQDGDQLWLKGRRKLRLFTYGNEPIEIDPDTDLSHLLKPLSV